MGPLFYQFTLQDLLNAEGLARVDAHFLSFLEADNAKLLAVLRAYRQGDKPDPKQESAFLIDLSLSLQITSLGVLILVGSWINYRHKQLRQIPMIK